MSMTHSLVIGGTRGIGRAVVRKFMDEGHAVSVIGRREAGEKDKNLKNVTHATVDMTQKAAMTKVLADLVAKNGPVANLVFCQRYRGPDDAWIGEWATSLTATKDIIEGLAAGSFAASASVVVIGSIASEAIVDGQPASYHVGKAAQVQLVRYFAATLGKKGVRVNCVSPCTMLKEESKDFYLNDAGIMQLYSDLIPLGRMGTSEDVAGVVSFLCSPSAAFVTGATITVDGGMSLRWPESIARAYGPQPAKK